jgi:hypothetical protein
MKQRLLFFGLLLSAAGFTQKTTNPDTYAKSITADDLKKHLYIVAGPEMEGRETATPGQRKAAAYIETQFKNLGLLPGSDSGYQMYYNVYQDSLISAALEVAGQAFQMDKDFNANTTNIAATMRFSEVVLVGAAATDSLKNANLAGKLIMLVGAMPATGGRGGSAGGIYGALQNKGIAGILMVSTAYPRTTPTPLKGQQTMNAFRRALTPQQFTISENVARAIVGPDYDTIKNNTSLLKTYTVNVLLDVKKVTLTAQSSNVIALLPGTDLKDEYVVLSAHYDHLGIRNGVIYYGADDDGSGTVSVLELAEAFAKAKAAGKGPRRSIIFMTVSGEEKGLWGSEYYTSHPTFPLEKTSVNLNIDMIGRSDPDRKVGDSTNYVYVVGDDKLSSDLRTISEAQNKKFTKLELDYKYNDPNDTQRIYYRSDHYNFAKNGVPIIFYYDGMLRPDYHRPSDTPDKINYPLMAKRAQLVFYTAWDMANRNDKLKRDLSLPAANRPL